MTARLTCFVCLLAVAFAQPATADNLSAPQRTSPHRGGNAFMLGPVDEAPTSLAISPEEFVEQRLEYPEQSVAYIGDGPLEGDVLPSSASNGAADGSFLPASDDYGNPAEYRWRLMPRGMIYRSYLAGAKESRFRSVWNNAHNDGNLWDITLGGRAPLIRYGTGGTLRPEGYQLSLEGAGLVRLDSDEGRDVDAADFRFGVPLTWGDAVSQTKFAFYHLSSHVGDEYLLKHSGFNRLNYSRNVLVFGKSYYLDPNWRVYGEVGYGVTTDVSKPWELQFGFSYSPAANTGYWGAPFVAFNGHLREEVDYGGNFVAQAGWAWRSSPASGLFRTGVEYYNGKDDQFSFFDDSVQKVGFGMWYDY